MTEEEWLACDKLVTMLRFLGGKVSDRKWRLFACACCRRIWNVLPADAHRNLVAVVEDHPDGTFDDPDLHAAIVASSSSWTGGVIGYLAIKYLGRTYYKVRASDSPMVALCVVQTVVEQGGDKTVEGGAQVVLVRDIVGNPFRPVTIASHWLTPTVASLALAAYDERALPFGELDTVRLSILADALEDAGCTDDTLLSHLRSPGPHVRGCFALDLLLGKS